MSLLNQNYRESNQYQGESNDERSPIHPLLNSPELTSHRPTPDIAPFDNRPPSPPNYNLEQINPLIPSPDNSPPSFTSNPTSTDDSIPNMTNPLDPPSFPAATAGTHYGGQASTGVPFGSQATAGPSNLFGTSQTTAPIYYANPGTASFGTTGATTVAQAASSVPTPMPVRKTKNAPRTFRGDSHSVEHFIDHLEQLFSQHKVTDSQEKCKHLIKYCSHEVEGFIKSLQSYRSNNWSLLKADLLKYYDADKAKSWYRPANLSEYLKRCRYKNINSLTQWKRYFVRYSTIAGQLLHKGIINQREYESRIWQGFPKELRTALELMLRTQEPAHDMSTPYTMTQICRAADTHFQCDKFTDMLFPTFGEDYDSDSESENSSNSDTDSEDSEDSENRCRKKRKLLKKRKARKEVKPHVEEREKVHRYQGSPVEIESMIHQLNTMSLQDRNYGHLYYKVMHLDTTGIAAKCVYCEPLKVAATPQYVMPMQEAPPLPPRPSVTYPNNLPLGNLSLPPRPIRRTDNQCYGCLKTGHMLGECPQMKELLDRNAIFRSPENRKYYMRNGQAIIRRPGESLYDAATRYNSIPVANLVTLSTGTSQLDDYSYHSEDIDSEDEYSDSDSDSDDGPYRKYAFQAKRQLYHPTSYQAEEYYDPPYQVYPAERTPIKRSTEARKENSRVPTKPAKQTFDGVWPPDR